MTPFIIAEVGSNWLSFEHCKDSISAAKACGADAVKFQAFNSKALYGFDDAVGHNPHDDLPLEWLPKLKEKADACGIEFMCTAFSPEILKAVDPFVRRHKIASSDLCYSQLLQAAKETGKPIILSCGASNEGEIKIALDQLGDADVTLLYCNASYPSRWHNLEYIEVLKKFNRPVGLSDHSLDVICAPLTAAKFYGASVIEKHFTILPDDNTADRMHSLTSNEFLGMTKALKSEKYDTYLPSIEEKAMFLRHRRRLVAIQNINIGDKLEYGINFGICRTLNEDAFGGHPIAWEHFQNKVSKNAVEKGKGLPFSILD